MREKQQVEGLVVRNKKANIVSFFLPINDVHQQDHAFSKKD
jgi:hypothetical protein